MLPVIFLLGSPSSGKSTLGERLATEFNMHHISLKDLFLTPSRIPRKPIPNMSDEINACLVNMEEIPASVVAKFKPGPIPIVLQLHNRRIQNRFEPNRAGELLKEKIAEIIGNCGVLPRAIIIDDLNLALSGGYGRSFEEKLHAFAPTYAGLTIVIQCPHDVAKSRYMQESRCMEIDSDRFEAEIRRDNALHEELRRQGVVVTTVNDNIVTADEPYQTLLKRLDEFPLWGFLIGKYR